MQVACSFLRQVYVPISVCCQYPDHTPKQVVGMQAAYPHSQGTQLCLKAKREPALRGRQPKLPKTTKLPKLGEGSCRRKNRQQP